MEAHFQTAAGDAAKSLESPEIKPSLSPKSDKHFFGKDYTDDLRPAIDAHPKWSYPYPKVQTQEKYDTDYVKDENNDGGHWKAQMDYDEIKMKYVKQQAVVRAAAIKAGMEKDEAMKAAGIKDQMWLWKNLADAKAAQAMADNATAWKSFDAATSEETAAEKAAWEAAQAQGKSKAQFEAEQNLKQAELHLKDCEKAVADAKAELEATQAGEKARFEAEEAAKKAAIEAAMANLRNANGTAMTEAQKAAAAAAAAAAAQAEADKAKAAADKEAADIEGSGRSLAEEQEKLKQLEKQMLEAEKRLREYRGELPAKSAQFHAEDHGHSGANQMAVGMFALTVMTISVFA